MFAAVSALGVSRAGLSLLTHSRFPRAGEESNTTVEIGAKQWKHCEHCVLCKRGGGSLGIPPTVQLCPPIVHEQMIVYIQFIYICTIYIILILILILIIKYIVQITISCETCTDSSRRGSKEFLFDALTVLHGAEWYNSVDYMQRVTCCWVICGD